MLLAEAVIVDIQERIRACQDAEDDKFLDVAVAGSASCLVSGDADLLELNPFRGVPILSPAEFLAWLPDQLPPAH